MNVWRSTFLHMRLPLHNLTLFGFLFAVLVLRPPADIKLLAVFVSWFLLSIGLTLFNDYYDKDVKPVAGLDHPPPVTQTILITGLVFMFLAQIIAYFVNVFYFSLVTSMAVISTMYSHPKVRIKKYALGAVIVNGVGGAAAFLAVSSLKPNMLYSLLGAGTLGIGLAAVYLITQLHQAKEDNERGDTSVTKILGKKRTVGFSIGLLVLAGVLGSVLLLFTQNILVLSIVVLYFLFCLLFMFKWWSNLEKYDHISVMKVLLSKVFLGANILFLAILLLVY